MTWSMIGKPTVRVHLDRDGPSIEGILISRFGRHLKLVGARVVQGEGRSFVIDGTAIIPRERVAFWQEMKP